MNKNIKKIIAVALTVSAFCAIAPATNLNLMTTKAYASSNDAEELSELELKTSGGSTIKFYEDDDYDDRVDSDEIKEGKTYYAKTSSSRVKIDIDGVDEDKVRIFKGSSEKDYEVGDKISLSSGTTTLEVLVFEDDYKDYKDYDDAKDHDYNKYKIRVKCTADDDDDDDDQDDIYLDDLKITHDGDSISGFSFDKKKSSYDITVPESVDDVRIQAEPKDEDEDKVIIDGYVVDDDDNYRRTVDLTKGKKNVIEVEVKNDDDKRKYTLNITRKSDTSTNTNDKKTNQWVNSNGKWVYNDGLGNPVKNMWFTDRNQGKTYYLQADGTMATGWLYKDGFWYYLSANGEKQTGWALSSGNWYYLDSEGKMQTGWLRDWSGKWYYLQSSGIMSKNTKVGGFKLGADGAWVK